MRRVHQRLALAVAVLSISLVAPVTAAGVTATCAGAAEGETVAIVIDFGDVTDQGERPGGVETFCVPWRSGMRGGDAMRDAGLTMRFGTSGLLCAIDGYPAGGCGDRTGQGGYYYWSYWKAGAGETSWSYSTTGAATPVRAGVTEGWRFVKGAGSPNDPQPRRAPDHDEICPDAPPPAPAPTAPSAVEPGVVPPAAATGPAVSTTVPGGDVVVAPPEEPAAGAADPSTTTSTPVGRDDEVALADTAAASASSDVGGAVGAIALVVLIVGLGGAALVRARRPADG